MEKKKVVIGMSGGVDSIVVEEDHFEWKYNIFNDILKLNLEGKKTKLFHGIAF